MLITGASIALALSRHVTFRGTYLWQEYDACGLVLVPVAVLLAGRLIVQSTQRVCRPGFVPTSSIVGAPNRIPFVLWRLVVTAILVCLLIRQYRLITFHDQIKEQPVVEFGYLGNRVFAQSGTLAVSGTLLVGGVLLGASLRREGSNRRVISGWRKVLGWFLVVAFLVVSVVQFMFIPFLVLISIENLTLAMRYWDGSGPGCLQRISHSASPTVLAFAVCLFSGIWQAHDLRPSSLIGSNSRYRFIEVYGRYLATLMPAAVASYLVFVQLPWLNTALSEGLDLTIGPAECGMVLLGFAGLGAGIAARAVDARALDHGSPGQPAWQVRPQEIRPSRIALQGAVMAASIVTALAAIVVVLHEARVLPGPVAAKLAGYGGSLSSHTLFRMTYFEICLFWLLILAVRILFAGTLLENCAFDTAFQSLAQFRAFLWRWLAITVLMASCLPTLFFVGLVGYYYLLKAWP